MKPSIFFFSVLIFSLSVFGQSDDLRKSYRAATKSEENAKTFYKYVEDVSESDKAVMMAYKGAGETLLARFAPLAQRRGKVKSGIELVKKAVQKDPDNVEVRLIRLSIQENLPKMFKYNSEIEADKKFIKNVLPGIKDKGLLDMINGYFAGFSNN